MPIRRKSSATQSNTAVIYVRFSSNNQREESIDAQIRACTAFAEQNGLHVVEIYADQAKSATTSDREQFQQMIADCKKGKCAYVIVHKLDRFSRDKYDSVTYKRILKTHNVTLLSVTENLDGSPESVMLESVIEGMSQYYSMNLSREVMKGLKENAYSCKHTGGFAPLGYDVDPTTKKLVISEDEAKTVRKIFEMYTTGYGYKLIMDHLNSMGYRTKFDNKFGSNSLHTILKNEKYTGTYVYNKKLEKGVDGKRRPSLKPESEVIRIEGGIPAIIDKETFDKAQSLLARNLASGGRFKSKENYLLSRIAYCGECGSALYGNCKHSGRNKTKHVTYRCSNRTQHKGCKVKETNKAYLENFVLGELYQNLFNEKSIKKLAYMLTEYNKKHTENNRDELAQATKQLETVANEINRLLDIVSEGKISINTIKDRLKEAEDKKNYLESYIDELTVNDTLQITEEMILTLIEKSKDFIRTKNIAECKMFIDSYIDKVLVYKNHVEVFYKINVPAKDGQNLEPLKSTIDRDTLYAEYKDVI